MTARLLTTAAVATMLALSHGAIAQNPTTMRIAGNFSSNTKHVDTIEKPFLPRCQNRWACRSPSTTTRWTW